MVHEAASPSSRAKSKSIGESPFTFPKFLGKFAFPSDFAIWPTQQHPPKQTGSLPATPLVTKLSRRCFLKGARPLIHPDPDVGDRRPGGHGHRPMAQVRLSSA
jgi:hypothetical protein